MDPDSIRTTDLPPGSCPACGEVLGAVTGTSSPTPGCITLCLYCRVFLVFTDTLQQRLLSNAEWLKLPVDQRELLTRVRDGVRSLT